MLWNRRKHTAGMGTIEKGADSFVEGGLRRR